MPRAASVSIPNAGDIILQQLGQINDGIVELRDAVKTLIRVEEQTKGLVADVARITQLIDGIERRVADLERSDAGTRRIESHKRDWLLLWIGIGTLLAGIALVWVELPAKHEEVQEINQFAPDVNRPLPHFAPSPAGPIPAVPNPDR